MENIEIEYNVKLPNVPKALGDWGNEHINIIVSVIEFIENISEELTDVTDITTLKFTDVDDLRQNDIPCIVFRDDNDDEYILSFCYSSLNKTLTIHLMESACMTIVTYFVIGMNFMEPIELLQTSEIPDIGHEELIDTIYEIINKVVSNWEQQKIDM